MKLRKLRKIQQQRQSLRTAVPDTPSVRIPVMTNAWLERMKAVSYSLGIPVHYL